MTAATTHLKPVLSLCFLLVAFTACTRLHFWLIVRKQQTFLRSEGMFDCWFLLFSWSFFASKNSMTQWISLLFCPFFCATLFGIETEHMRLIAALKQPLLWKKVSFEWLFCVVFCRLTLRSILNSFSNPFLPFLFSGLLLDVFRSYSPSLESIALSFVKMLASFDHGPPWSCHKVDCCGLKISP